MKKPDSSPPVDLKDPYTAVILTLVIPGLGHFYQGRVAKAILFAVCVCGLFLIGAYLGSSKKYGPARVVYYSMRPDDARYYFFGQMWIGLAASPAALQYFLDPSGEEPILRGLMAPPVLKKVAVQTRGGLEMDEVSDLRFATGDNIRQELGRYFELGTIFTVVAGLLNIFVLLDAYAGPFPEKEEEAGEAASGKEEAK